MIKEQDAGQFKFSRDLITAMIRNGNSLGLIIFQDKGHPEITAQDIETAFQVAEDLQNHKPGGALGRRGH